MAPPSRCVQFVFECCLDAPSVTTNVIRMTTICPACVLTGGTEDRQAGTVLNQKYATSNAAFTGMSRSHDSCI